jgi:Predicted extracellular endo alpha-1,4 polygalactosaminidase or related polysaccharide hydrolase
MARLLPIALVTALLLGLATASGSAANSRKARLAGARSFAFAIGDGTLRGDLSKRYARFDLVLVDGESAGARAVNAIRRKSNGLVLAYLDVGTIESYRGWYNAAKPYRLDYWGDWGEWYANVNASGFRSLMLKRVAPAMLAKGFDGLFLDNTDMTETHPAQKRGMRTLVAGLSRLVRARGKLLMAQNGADVNWPLRRFYNGINFEDVSFSYDFDRHAYFRQSARDVARAQREIRRYLRAGLKLTTTDYVAAGKTNQARIAVRNACSAGALPYVSDINLTRVPAQPFLCG